MPLKNVVEAEGLDGGRGIWAFGNNEDAFKPAVYAPYCLPVSWCLYVDKATSRAILVEHVENTGSFTVSDIALVVLVEQKGALMGRGHITNFPFDSEGRLLMAQAMGGRYLSAESPVSFVLEGPIHEGDRPDAVHVFLPAMLEVWRHPSVTSRPAP